MGWAGVVYLVGMAIVGQSWLIVAAFRRLGDYLESRGGR